ncbi:unnamed protein product [Tetraodon nigroviridis]|uniref:(spotted green pufferfish) hypothetical protein n=1 Tax=Tetraodon nigroviridis TaxID=99883 RepID=Q4REF6_TETNG|nr:unnamed protein product [Tetraodon nigroviridis]
MLSRKKSKNEASKPAEVHGKYVKKETSPLLRNLMPSFIRHGPTIPRRAEVPLPDMGPSPYPVAPAREPVVSRNKSFLRAPVQRPPHEVARRESHRMSAPPYLPRSLGDLPHEYAALPRSRPSSQGRRGPRGQGEYGDVCAGITTPLSLTTTTSSSGSPGGSRTASPRTTCTTSTTSTASREFRDRTPPRPPAGRLQSGIPVMLGASMAVCHSPLRHRSDPGQVPGEPLQPDGGGPPPSRRLDGGLDHPRQEVLHRPQHQHHALEPPPGEGGASAGLGEGGVGRVRRLLRGPHQQESPVPPPLRPQVPSPAPPPPRSPLTPPSPRQRPSLRPASPVAAARGLPAAGGREEPAGAGARQPLPHGRDPRLAAGLRPGAAQVRPHPEVGAVPAGRPGHLPGHAEAALHEGAGAHRQVLRGLPAGAAVRGRGPPTAPAVVRPAARQELPGEHVRRGGGCSPPPPRPAEVFPGSGPGVPLGAASLPNTSVPSLDPKIPAGNERGRGREAPPTRPRRRRGTFSVLSGPARDPLCVFKDFHGWRTSSGCACASFLRPLVSVSHGNAIEGRLPLVCLNYSRCERALITLKKCPFFNDNLPN